MVQCRGYEKYARLHMSPHAWHGHTDVPVPLASRHNPTRKAHVSPVGHVVTACAAMRNQGPFRIQCHPAAGPVWQWPNCKAAPLRHVLFFMHCDMCPRAPMHSPGSRVQARSVAFDIHESKMKQHGLYAVHNQSIMKLYR